MQDGEAEPLACQEGQLDLQAALAHGMPEGVFGLADPVLDTVLVHDEPFRGGLEAAVLLQEDAESVAQPGIMVVVGGQRPQGLVHPGPQQLDRARHQGQRRDLGEAGQPLPRGTRGQRDRLGAHSLAVGATEAGQASARSAQGEPRPEICPAGAAAHGPTGEAVPGAEGEPGPGAGLVLGNKDRQPFAMRLTCQLHVACSSRASVRPPGSGSSSQPTTPTWCWRSR
jgi:hypothetical protein